MPPLQRYFSTPNLLLKQDGIDIAVDEENDKNDVGEYVPPLYLGQTIYSQIPDEVMESQQLQILEHQRQKVSSSSDGDAVRSYLFGDTKIAFLLNLV